MAKKSTAIVTKPQSEAAEAATSDVISDAVIDRPDPTLLGVRVPLAVTFAAFRQVTDAWGECLRELSVAVKSKGVKVVSPPEGLDDTPTVNA